MLGFQASIAGYTSSIHDQETIKIFHATQWQKKKKKKGILFLESKKDKDYFEKIHVVWLLLVGNS